MTVTSSFAHTSRNGNIYFTALQTVTSNDTTDPINTPAIDITGFDLAAVSFGYSATSAAANSTMAQMIIQGTTATKTAISAGTAAWVTLTDGAGTSLASSAATIGAADSASPVGRVVSSRSFSGVTDFPFTHLRGQVDQSGTSVGFTGVITASLSTRKKQNS